MQQIENIINHFGFVIDESSSMSHLAHDLIRVVDGELTWLGSRSKELSQETRVSAWAFNSGGTEQNVLWDMDALRVPSIAGKYHPKNLTALRDGFMLALDDFALVTQKYGQHGFVLYGLTDGGENDSRTPLHTFKQRMSNLPDNVTVAILVPDDRCARLARDQGFPPDNVMIWNPTTAAGLEAGGSLIREASENYFQARTQGVVKPTGSLFRVNALSEGDLSGLAPLTEGSYVLAKVPEDMRIDVFVAGQVRAYTPGQAYYRLTKAETVQDYKKVAVRDKAGRVFMSPDLRTRLGLPSSGSARVRPAIGGLEVWVQSTSHNRKLIGGTEVLILR